MAAGPDPLALELDRLAVEFRPMLPAPAPDGPPPADPRDFHAALWAFLITASLAAMVLGLAVGAAIRRFGGLPVLGSP